MGGGQVPPCPISCYNTVNPIFGRGQRLSRNLNKASNLIKEKYNNFEAHFNLTCTVLAIPVRSQISPLL